MAGEITAQRTLSTTWRIVLCIVVTMLLGASGGIITETGTGTWYDALNKPSFQPPDWLFGPVWTTLFFLMGLAAGMVWSAKTANYRKGQALGAYSVQLGLNIAWSLIFFGFESPKLALIEIVILWIAILVTLQLFYKINKTAGLLLVPYLLWVTFATVLNAAIVLLN
jgi:tryptophan-rich sensory protein